ncbi:bifunctional acyl-ACP--phospholipid O-acyltransferase/long-chain-fatty-acid--ACP ligase [Ignatzschineria ureiclastica]|uniref:Bifunctional acyl-ACP--phospholipid O-acyltransferase/long-chain-fatty-acid--ACP ligase n=1 Tax=Ignatzschineria ureiclastica TaxID=472582 RepID=A0A2U2AF79_9GAMM|nr:bifunctional acyl-ACP--phospholipid O-acyltransferase/long-chain-fatty-acid--ACP ligase [Ignatzschineria ureiclastica]PWD81277.1 bifunctional acyl-ACP--phospholipid O-acyltransferase/long-chain-fatty-acid--ACP ligase [Ignatzschineria ureiclastica]GGZ97706.1 bifunctional protein Aas [Ignatzschineria ureiclastica]
MKWLLRVFFTFFYRIKTNIAPESQDQQGIIICNHLSFLDGILLGLFLPQTPLFVIDRLIADRWYFKWPLKFVPHLTLDPTHPMSIKTLIQVAKEGRSIVIFPEGRITLTGSFMKIYEGAAFTAYKSGKPLIPVYIEGAEKSYFSRLKGLVKQRLFPQIKITMQAPIEITIPSALKTHQIRHYLAQLTQEILMNTRLDVFNPTSLFASIVQARADFGKDKICIEDITRKPMSYQKLIESSLALSRLFKKTSQEQERMGVLLPNTNAAAITILGLNAINRVSALINYSAGIEGVDAAVTAADLKTIITSKKFIQEAKLHALVAHFPDIQWIYLEDLKSSLTLRDKLWVWWCRRRPMKYLPKVSADDEAIILFTSGSEGKPKGVVHTNRSLLTNVEQLRTVADFTAKDTFMVVLPLFHAFGLTAGLFTSIISGAKAFLYPSPLHYRVIPEMIYELQATVFFGTSTFLQNYARYAKAADLASLRYVVAGAEKLNQTVKESWQEKFGIRILEGYGATECAPVITINVPNDYKENTIGKILPGIEAKLETVEGIDEGGKLLVKGNNVMKGYLHYQAPGVVSNESLAQNGGWYDTGDIVKIDDEGFLTVIGRAKRFAKIAGEMVSLETAERIFREAYPDYQHAAVTREDQSKGEAIVIYTTAPMDTDRKALVQTAKELGLPELAISRDIRFIQELPRLGSGKVSYQALQALITTDAVIVDEIEKQIAEDSMQHLIEAAKRESRSSKKEKKSQSATISPKTTRANSQAKSQTDN